MRDFVIALAFILMYGLLIFAILAGSIWLLTSIF